VRRTHKVSSPRVAVTVGKGPLGATVPKPMSGRFADGQPRVRRTPPGGDGLERICLVILALIVVRIVLALVFGA